jgi:hypothetical protein
VTKILQARRNSFENTVRLKNTGEYWDLHPCGYWWRIVKLGVILNFSMHSPRSIFEFATNILAGEP